VKKRERGNGQDQINRRKTQNRISQRCVREKARAHAKQIESLSTIIKSTGDPSGLADLPARYQALLTSHLSLLEMNKDLSDALLRMRKKLFSLSTAAGGAAGKSLPHSMKI
jgi:hypothetical protein